MSKSTLSKLDATAALTAAIAEAIKAASQAGLDSSEISIILQSMQTIVENS